MNKDRRKQIQKMYDDLTGCKDLFEALQSEEQEYYDNMPENIQQGPKGEYAQEILDMMDDVMSSFDDLISYLETLTESF